MQGDIEKIVDSSGKAVVTYTYDVFGKIISQTDTSDCDLANINPFRYRGYVYDSETGLYYLKSRYYDPVTGRFLNADMYCDTQSNIFGTNMFAYCNNNWVNQIDPEGTDAMWLQFGNAIQILGSYNVHVSIKTDLLNFGFSVTTKPIQLGHTSLMVEDAYSTWWYFYWGDKHIYLRPSGTSNFTSNEILNSYLSGFDPRWYHNYYVYPINVFQDYEDTGYRAKDSSNFSHKIHDGLVTNSIYFNGDFSDSYKYCYKQLVDAANQEKRGSLYKYLVKCKEGNKTISFFHLDNYDENAKEYKNLKAYNLLTNNCVQQTINALKNSEKVRNDFFLNCALTYGYNFMVPNIIFSELVVYIKTGKQIQCKIDKALEIIRGDKYRWVIL